jgi:transcriptional regulator with XRE-family HTH domain
MQTRSHSYATVRVIELLGENPGMTNLELANEIGITRQRVSQIRIKNNLPPPTRRRGWHPCPACGKTTRARQLFCSRACQHDQVQLTCETCNSKFYRSKRVANDNAEKGYAHIWCSKQCQGSWFGGLKRRISEIVSR